jgi:hypothetical protein
MFLKLSLLGYIVARIPASDFRSRSKITAPQQGLCQRRAEDPAIPARDAALPAGRASAGPLPP